MTTITVWILVYYNYINSAASTAVVVDNIATLESCQHLQQNIPAPSPTSRCIQVVKVKN